MYSEKEKWNKGNLKAIFSLFFSNKPLSEQGLSIVILSFRIFSGLMMIPYGIGKIQNFEKYSINFFDDPIGIGMVPSLILTIFAQVVCALSLTIGLFSRPAALILAFNMLIATKYHWHDDFATLSLPLLFLGMYCILSLTGGGKYAMDSFIFNYTKAK